MIGQMKMEDTFLPDQILSRPWCHQQLNIVKKLDTTTKSWALLQLLQKSNCTLLKQSPSIMEANIEEELEKHKKINRPCVEQEGEESTYAMRARANFAGALKKAYHGVEADRLFAEVVATSIRVHGPDNHLTKAIVSNFQLCITREVEIKSHDGMEVFQALR